MIDADDLRDALIYGIENAQRKLADDRRTLLQYDPKGHQPDTQHRVDTLTAVDRVLDELLAKLTGDWPATRG